MNPAGESITVNGDPSIAFLYESLSKLVIRTDRAILESQDGLEVCVEESGEIVLWPE